MSRLVLDITELANWSGRLTGVPRVMNELAQRFVEQEGVVFAAWDPSRKNFYEVHYKKLHAGTSVDSIYEAKNRQKEQIKALAIKIAKWIHKKPILWRVVAVPEAIARSILLKRSSGLTGAEEPLRFQQGDKIFNLCEWHGGDPSFTEKLLGLKKQGVRIFQFAHDMLPIVTPQYSGHGTDNLTHLSKHIYPVCDVIVANSKHTKKDVAWWLRQNKLRVPPIKVVRLGDDFSIAEPIMPQNEDFKNKVLKRPFMLCVGTIEARKNHTLLYYTHKLAKSRNIDLPPVVIVGRMGWRTNDFYDMAASDPETKDKLIFLHNTSDEELAWLYKHCLFSVYPSFYEGWGLPIAESIAHGVPCVSSNTSSMTEIAGDLITYFSPTSTDECLSEIVRMLDNDYRARVADKIKQYKPCSWSETYRQVSEAIRSENERNN